jgi:tellurite resistance protein TerC
MSVFLQTTAVAAAQGGATSRVMEGVHTWHYAVFIGFVLAVLLIDLLVFQRKAHVVAVREAAIWTGVWVSLALAFNALIYVWQGADGQALDASVKFFTGYIIELSLSVDNLFVFVLIFGTFRVPAELQHRVLFWGIVGAQVMRGLFIGLGPALVNRLSWVLYVFGAFLVYTGIKMALQKEVGLHPEENPIVHFFRRFVPMTSSYQGSHFFVREEGRLLATPLALVLVIVESTDVVFAVDSIPAIFAITTDPFIVFTSNIFAILGLRTMYFLLAHVVDKFHYLKIALSVILTYVGVKMLVTRWIHISPFVSLGIIASVLILSIVASVVRAKKLQRESGAVDPTTL